MKLASRHALRLTCAGEDDKSEEGADGEGSEEEALLNAPDHPCHCQDPTLLAGEGGERGSEGLEERDGRASSKVWLAGSLTCVSW